MSDDAGWVLIGLDEKLAKKQGVPPRVPVPKADFESIADKGLGIDQVRKWVTAFMATPGAQNSKWRVENASLVKAYDAFLAKGGSWQKAQEAFAKNDMKGAIGALKLVCNLDPNDHAARLNLASALANNTEFPAALKLFEAIKDTYADDADYHVALGHVHLAMANKDLAVGEMVLALEASPGCAPALEALKQLGVLIPVYENPRDATSLTYVRADSVVEYLETVWDAEPRDLAYFLEQIAYHRLAQRGGARGTRGDLRRRRANTRRRARA